jgi:hypothetical protein
MEWIWIGRPARSFSWVKLMVPDDWGNVQERQAERVRADARQCPECAGRLQRSFLVCQLML